MLEWYHDRRQHLLLSLVVTWNHRIRSFLKVFFCYFVFILALKLTVLFDHIFFQLQHHKRNTVLLGDKMWTRFSLEICVCFPVVLKKTDSKHKSQAHNYLYSSTQKRCIFVSKVNSNLQCKYVPASFFTKKQWQ